MKSILDDIIKKEVIARKLQFNNLDLRDVKRRLLWLDNNYHYKYGAKAINSFLRWSINRQLAYRFSKGGK